MLRFSEWVELEEANRIPEDAIKIHLPKVEQTTNFSCGSACLRAIADFFGVGPDKEGDFIKLLHSDPEDGTTPANIVKVARMLDLHAFARQGMTIDSLKSRLEKHIPVICALQAYGDTRKYPTKDASGHYVVAIGHDDKSIYFEDPALKKTRGFLPYREFLDRWHDEDANGKKWMRLGIAIWRATPPENVSDENEADVIESTRMK